MRGAVVAALSFTLLALAWAVAAGWFGVRPATADTGAMFLLAPLVYGILLAMIAIGAVLAALAGAAGAAINLPLAYLAVVALLRRR